MSKKMHRIAISVAVAAISFGVTYGPIVAAVTSMD